MFLPHRKHTYGPPRPVTVDTAMGDKDHEEREVGGSEETLRVGGGGTEFISGFEGSQASPVTVIALFFICI
jgi:hypothetical protein